MVTEKGDRKIFHHGGSNKGINCNFQATIIGKTLNGSVVMTNSSSGHKVIDELEKTIDDVYGWQAFKPIERNLADIRFTSLKKHIGSIYEGERYNLVVVNDDGKLALVDSEDNPPEPRDIFPESETSFFDLDGHMYELTPEKLIWKIRGGKRTIEFKRKK